MEHIDCAKYSVMKNYTELEIIVNLRYLIGVYQKKQTNKLMNVNHINQFRGKILFCQQNCFMVELIMINIGSSCCPSQHKTA